jgi:diguanylate cyclase (GGDEF)-like protein
MPSRSNKYWFSGGSRKGQAGLKSENDPPDAEIRNMAVDSQSLFLRSTPPLLPNGDPLVFDRDFEALLSEAHRELASLLQEMNALPDGTLHHGSPSQPINELLIRAVRCAAKQHMLLAELGNLALTDELTGLYNRRGFMAITERQLRIGRRSRREMLLFFIDVDGLKQINDSFGHSEGDRVLKRSAQALEMTFRDSDVIARMAGDEFAVLAVEATGDSEAAIRTRLCGDLKSICAGESRYAINLSLGVARFDPADRTSIGELMVQADQSMYEEKRRRATSSIDCATG